MATPEEVRHLAALSRISVSEEALPAFAKEFDAILAYVGKLDELTLPEMDERAIPDVRNVFRADSEPHEVSINTEKLVKQFPQKEGNLLSVKQIIVHD